MEVATKPGVANVSAADEKKLAPLLAKYARSPRPFRDCVRDQLKHGLALDHAKARCGVIKALIRAKNLSELREYVDMLDASGASCDQLQEARRVLDMAAKKIQEDDPRWNWRTMGNKQRGVILKNGKRIVVTPAQFDRLKAKGQLSPRTPRLKGDDPKDGPPSAAKAPSPSVPAATKVAAASKNQLIKHRITRGPRKGQVVEGVIINGKFWEKRTNTDAKNPRKGLSYLAGKDAKGRKIHIYSIKGKRQAVVVK